jgi:hypothetical protein
MATLLLAMKVIELDNVASVGCWLDKSARINHQ